MISWITPNIAIGELSDIVYGNEDVVENIKRLEELGITTVLDVREESHPKESQGFRDAWQKGILIRYHWEPVPCEIGKDKFLTGLNLAYCKLSSIFFADCKEKVLVHCTGGIDRSPFVVALYLHRHENMTFEDAYKLVKSKRPCVTEHYEWVWWEDY